MKNHLISIGTVMLASAFLTGCGSKDADYFRANTDEAVSYASECRSGSKTDGEECIDALMVTKEISSKTYDSWVAEQGALTLDQMHAGKSSCSSAKLPEFGKSHCDSYDSARDAKLEALFVGYSSKTSDEMTPVVEAVCGYKLSRDEKRDRRKVERDGYSACGTARKARSVATSREKIERKESIDLLVSQNIDMSPQALSDLLAKSCAGQDTGSRYIHPVSVECEASLQSIVKASEKMITYYAKPVNTNEAVKVINECIVDAHAMTIGSGLTGTKLRQASKEANKILYNTDVSCMSAGKAYGINYPKMYGATPPIMATIKQ